MAMANANESLRESNTSQRWMSVPAELLIDWSLAVTPFIVAAAAFFVDRGRVLNLVFPALSAVVGVFLFFRNPRTFLSFAWWLWFLTPFVRRIADLQAGYNAVNPIMLAPLLVSGIAGITMILRAPSLRLRILFGFVPILLALFYASIVGMITTGVAVAIYSLMTWAAPVLLAMHLALRPEDYEAHRRALISTFGWGVLAMGAYGVVQYFLAPPWDTYWMIASDQLSSGMPYAREIRVFSTMNSNGPFAFVISAGLLLILVGHGRMRLPMAALGCAGLMLSLVRAAWLGIAFGFIYLLICLPGRDRFRAVMLIGIAAIALAVTLMSGEVAETISKRFETLYNIEDDGSYQLRQEFYADFLSRAVTNIVGEGLGSTSHVTKLGNFGEISSGFYGDSGVMQMPFVLGWLGTLLYVGGLLGLLRYALSRFTRWDDLFLLAARAIALMIFAEMLFENTLVNVTGACFFTFLGMCLAAHRLQHSS
jgi:hypothetical protein